LESFLFVLLIKIIPPTNVRLPHCHGQWSLGHSLDSCKN